MVAADTLHPERSRNLRRAEAEVFAVAIHTPAGSRPHSLLVGSKEEVAPVAAVPVTALEDSVVVVGELVVAPVELCSTRLIRPCCFLVPSPLARHPVSESRRSFRIPQEMQVSTPQVLTITGTARNEAASLADTAS